MKMTLLQMTQNILSAMDSDEVNSIGDTPESLQVANAIQTTYMNMLGRLALPEHFQLIQLNPSESTAQPVLMTKPDHVQRIEWIKYFDTNPADGTQFSDQFGAYSPHDINTDLQSNANGWSTISSSSITVSLGLQTFVVSAGLNILPGQTAFVQQGLGNTQSAVVMSGNVISYSGTSLVLNITVASGSGTFTSWSISQTNPISTGPGYKDVIILPVKDFLQYVNEYNVTQSDVQSMTLTIPANASEVPYSFTFFYKNDKQPQYCCIINNNFIVFDSFDATQDSTLQASKIEAMGWVSPNFQLVDTFTPILDDQQFPYLLNDAKSLAFEEIKKQPHRKAEMEGKRQLMGMQRWKALANSPTAFEQFANFGRRGGGRNNWWYGSTRMGYGWR